MKCYNTLVNEGGRPSHPVSLGRDILENPGEYREILSFWNRRSNNWEVFGPQLGEWQDFRKYQQRNREEGRFLTYINAVKRSFARHGFTRPFELDENLERQDKLMTWIEFLDYEYWKQDKDMKFVKRLQPEYDAAWKALVDSQVLRPFETEEFICNIKSTFQRASEEEWAEKAVESAKSAMVLAQIAITDPRRAHLSQQRLVAAQSQLNAAIKLLESIKQRNDLIDEFFKKTQLPQITSDGGLKRSYQSFKDNAERRSILLRWILQQIPLIELELNKTKVAVNESDVGDGTNRRKRNPTDDLTAGREGQLKRNCHDSADKERAIKRARHTDQTSNAAEPELLSIQLDRSKPDNSAAEVPPTPRKRQAKVYKKERESRRLAGNSPEFGMLPKRGEPAPPHKPLSRYPSNTHKPNPSSPCSHASSKKKSMAVKGATPRGISKSKREETTCSKRSKKRSGGLAYLQV
jgi:hypothetical protein